MIKANDPGLTSWIPVPEHSDFPIQNLPFGVGSPGGKSPRPVTRIGDTVIDLSALVDSGMFDQLTSEEQDTFYASTLNPMIALGREKWSLIRKILSDTFEAANASLAEDMDFAESAFYNADEVPMHLPVRVGDYTDFYSSREHATNVGIMFRDPANALFPNWKHLPVGYHGRSSSIVVSGTPIHRPLGQTMPKGAEAPVFGPSRLVDFELEMAFITGKATALGESVTTEQAADHIFGMVLFNDLSARDIQKWEYVPLGPFLAKNFGSVISPWIVTMEALEPFRTDGPVQDPEVFPYLKTSGKNNYDIHLEVSITPPSGMETVVCRSNHKYLYWNIYQQLAHQTVNGCNIAVGDMYGSGTISGPGPGSYGSMLELSWQGTKPVAMADGTERKFINDNDEIIMRGWCEKDGLRLGFGLCTTTILPAKQ